MLSRRNFLATLSLAGGTLGLAGSRLDALESPAPQPATGELFGGFVLLPEGAPVPANAKGPHRFPPKLCTTGVGRGGTAPTGQTLSVGNPEAAAARSGLRLYVPSNLGSELIFSGARVVEHDDGDIYAAILSYDSLDAKTRELSTNVTITAFADFMKPLPLWSSNPVEPGGPSVQLVKARYLPSPGIMVKSVAGHIFHWIADGTYYMVTIENNYPLPQARRLIKALVRVDP